MPDFKEGDKVKLPMGETATVIHVGKKLTTVVTSSGQECRFPHAALDFQKNGGVFGNL